MYCDNLLGSHYLNALQSQTQNIKSDEFVLEKLKAHVIVFVRWMNKKYSGLSYKIYYNDLNWPWVNKGIKIGYFLVFIPNSNRTQTLSHIFRFHLLRRIERYKKCLF